MSDSKKQPDFAPPPDLTQKADLHIVTTEGVVRQLETIRRTGLYGATIEEVAERLLSRVIESRINELYPMRVLERK